MTCPSNEESLPWPARALACAALACGTAAAAALSDPPIYHCDNSYSSHPCGDARPLDFGDPRSPDERAQGEDVARRERRLADSLTAERKARDTVPIAKPTRAKAPCTASAAGRCMGKLPHPRHARVGSAAASGPLIVKVPATSKTAKH